MHARLTRLSHRAFAAAIAIALATGLAPTTAMAAGFGFFFEYGRDFTASGGDLGNAASFTANPDATLDTFDRNEFGIGFALDTNLAKDRLFNYRLDLGFHTSDWANANVFTTGPAPGGGTTSTGINNGYGLMWNNAFGFGVLRNEHVRLWIGPAVRLNVDYYANDFTSLADVVDVQFGVGPEVGLNVHLGDHFTTTLSVAYNYKWGWYVAPNAFAVTGNNSLSHRDNYVGVNLAFFFRTGGDRFE